MIKKYITIIILVYQAILFGQNGQDTLQIKRKKLMPKYDKQKAEEFMLTQKQRWLDKKKLIEKKAKEKKIPIQWMGENGNKVILIDINRGIPIYRGLFNESSAQTISTDKVNEFFGLDGGGITAAIWDGGKIQSSHQELNGKVVNVETDEDYNDHATHVAGTMIASGIEVEAKGMAPFGNLEAYDFQGDIPSEMASLSPWINLSNHSYGIVAGWVWNPGEHSWYWLGDENVSSDEDYLFGFYNEESRNYDYFMHSINPYHLVIAAAGNSRNDVPNENDLYYYWDSNGNKKSAIYKNMPRQKNGGTDGYDCLPAGVQTAKNPLVVGAIDATDVSLSSFTSFGPTDDGRIKPDVVACGINVYSSVAFNSFGELVTDAYDRYDGTSMATPSVTGSTMLIYQKLNQIYPQKSFLASAIKALIINTADDADNIVGPDFRCGWGVMNTKKAIDLIAAEETDGEGSHIQDLTYEGNQIDIPIVSDGENPLIITICWNDPEGIIQQPTLNSREKILVHDLDMVLKDANGVSYHPFVMDVENPNIEGHTGDNDVDNVESIYRAKTNSQEYTLSISHEGILYSNQDFSIVVSGGKINYETPPPPSNLITIKIIKSHTEPPVLVDGQKIQSGATFNWTKGSQHTLEAIEELIDGYYYQFDDYSTNSTSNTPLPSFENPVTFTANQSTTIYVNFFRAYKITLDQVDEKDRRIENSKVYKWSGSSFKGFDIINEPYSFIERSKLSEVLKGSQQVLQGRKFMKWKVNDGEIANIQNYQKFNISNKEFNFVSILNPISKVVTVKNNFSGNNSGIIEFKDPWLIDYADADYGNALRNQGMDAPFKPVPSPFQPTGSQPGEYQGVFLNQGYNQGNWNPPYYSVRAREWQDGEINGKPVAHYFVNWGGTGVQYKVPDALETPVVFTTVGAQAIANFQGHMYSNSTSALGENNMPSLQPDGSGFIMVYEREGTIYEVHSSDMHNWGKENALTSAYASHEKAMNPGINALYDADSGVLTAEHARVWDKFDENTGKYTVDFKGINGGGFFTLQNETKGRFYDGPGFYDHPTHPAVAGYFHNETVTSAIVFKSNRGLECWFPNGNTNTLLSTSANADFPAIAGHKTNSSPRFFNPTYSVVWSENGNIRYKRFYRLEDTGQPRIAEDVILNAGYESLISGNGYPNIYHSAHGTFVVWQALQAIPNHLPVPVICFREKGSGSWGPLKIFGAGSDMGIGDHLSPVVVTLDNGSSDDVCILFKEAGNRNLRAIYRLNGTWQSGQTLNNNTAAVRAISHGTEIAYVSLEGDRYPFRIISGLQGLTSKAPLMVLSHERIAIVDPVRENGQNKAALQLRISDPLSGNQSLQPAVPDSELTTANAFTYRGYIAASEIHLPVSANATKTGEMGKGMKSFAFRNRLTVQTGGGRRVSRTLPLDGNYAETLRLNNKDRSAAPLEVSASLDLPLTKQMFIADYYRIPKETMMAGIKADNMAVTSKIDKESVKPTRFFLKQNYPNPFNPETTIEYGLTEASQVRLVIYNSMGQLVAKLVDSQQPAGFYRINWNGQTAQGQNLSSGVYFYRLEAVGQLSGNTQTAIHKMVFMK